MLIKISFSLTVALLMLALGMPAAAQADDWSFSPYLAQLQSQTDDGGELDGAPAADALSGKKNIGRGIMFSLVIPGTGQLYSGSWLRALPWFAVEVAGWALFSKYNAEGDDKTAEFEKFAGPHKNGDPSAGNFVYDAYMLREYQISQNSSINEQTTVYSGTLNEWKNENWDIRRSYLPAPYTHNINTADIQQYYEMIGKYFLQFGYGWIDTYDNSIDVNIYDSNTSGPIWSNGPNYTDDQSTIGFDGSSPLFFHYRDMRGEANDLLDKSNLMMEIVLVNHVLSALDAAFAIRSHNKKLEENRLGGLKLEYGHKYINGDLARNLTLSVPLNL